MWSNRDYTQDNGWYRPAASGGGGGFTPASLPGLIAWYKADADVYSNTSLTTPQTTNNGNVAGWKDQSGNGYHLTQATGQYLPTYLTAGLNGKPAISFAAAAPSMLASASGVAMGTGNVASAVMIGQLTSGAASNSRVVVYDSGGDTNPGSCIFMIRNGGSNAFAGYRSIPGFVGSQAISLATTYRMGIVFDGTNATTYLNNANPTATACTDSLSNGGLISIGAHNTAGPQEGWDGPIGEIIITNQAMSSGDRASLDAYLVARW